MGNWQSPDGVKRKNPARTQKATASPARGMTPQKKASPLQRFLQFERQRHGYGHQSGSYNVGRTRRLAV